MIEDEGDGGGIEPGVDGVEHRAGGRHAEMRLELRRGIGGDDGDRIAAADAAPRQRRGEPAAAHVECGVIVTPVAVDDGRSEEHTSELQSLMRISYAVFCLKKKKPQHTQS